MILGRALFVLGGPASGKGTQAVKLAQHINGMHISAGECLRSEVRRKGPLSS
jgi:UMP-CMP kinase